VGGALRGEMKFNRFYLITPLFLVLILRAFNPWVHASAAHYFFSFMICVTFAIVVGVWPQLIELTPWHKFDDGQKLKPSAPNGAEYHQK
jgi:hypothetical protein